ncbi:MAG: hypothetical protein QXU12_02535 [Nitrososphaerota archaeon]
MDETRRVIEALMQVGPRFTDISQVSGIPVSTVRYILLKKLPKFGFHVQISVDYAALGLQRYLVEFRSKYPVYHISKILDLLGECTYLDYYVYSMNERRFLSIFALPPAYEGDFLEFLNLMQVSGLIENIKVCKLVYLRALPLMTDFFDFSRGVWEQDWFTKLGMREIPESPEHVHSNPKVDKIDLIILSELQKRVTRIKYGELAQKFRLTRQTISKHYKHARNFIKLFAVYWFPPMNPELIAIPLLIRVPAESRYRKILINIPFTFSEFRSESGEYFAMLLVPSMGFYKTLEVLTSNIESLRMNFLDMRYTGKFTIQYNLFQKGLWINPFETAIEKLIQVVKGNMKTGEKG